MEPIIGEAAGAPAGDVVKDSDTANFMADVIEASRETPVVVDFWAPWCGPCKQLGPMIENAVRATRGAVKLVKINVDENQQLAAQFQVQSIPAVYAFQDGRPVDGFVGALPESQINQFIGRLGGEVGPSPIDAALEQAQAAMDAEDLGTAAAIYSQVLQAEPANTGAIAGLARCRLAAGDVEGAREVIDQVGGEQANDAAIAGARSAIELAEQTATADAGGDGGDIAELRAKLAANANDHQARYDLALALYGQGQREAAVDELLELIERDRKWNDEAGRKQLLKLFEAFGPTDPLTVEARQRLSTILFS